MNATLFLNSLLWLLPLSVSTSALQPETRVSNALAHHGVVARDEQGTAHVTSDDKYLYETDFEGTTWDVRNWRLRTTTLDQGHYQSRASIANGYFGLNVAAAGPFFELDVPVHGDVINGWPLFGRRQTFAGLAGFWDSQPTTNGSNFPWLYQYGWDTAISGVPHWGSLILDLGNDAYLDAKVDNKTISNYESTFDYKAGTLTWKYTWSPKKHDCSFDITYNLFVHKLDINQAVVRMTIKASEDVKASVVNLLEGYSAVRTNFVESGEDGDSIYSAVSPWGVDDVEAYIYAALEADDALDTSSAELVHDKPYIYKNASTIAQAFDVNFKGGKTVTITKYVGAASTDAFKDPQKVAKNAATLAKRRGYDSLLRSHVSEWAQVMPDDSVDDFTYDNGTLPNDPLVISSAVMAVVSPYYLLQNTVGENALYRVDQAPVNDHSISVGGLTSDSYAGQIFWDAETWMQPGLVASFPLSAQRIINYRVARYEQAQKNVQTANQTSKNKTAFSEDGALYPWTSGRYGNCTATGPCFDYQYHLNGDIGIALVNQWVVTGDTKTFKEVHFPIYNSVAISFADLLVKNGSKWTLTNMTDPDEYANHVDAGGYTLPLMAQTLVNANSFRKQFGMTVNETWNEMAENVLVLRQNGVTLEYTTMNNSVQVKQADIVLSTFPLDYSQDYEPENSLTDLEYYALKQSPDGPAMTWAIFSIVASEAAPSGCAGHTYAQYSYNPYLRGPWHQLSEQQIDDTTVNGGTHPAYPFLTGHGGQNQVVLYSYLGLRLKPDDYIHIDPNLPPQVPQVKYRTFYWQGWPITAWSNYTHTSIARATTIKPLDTANKKFENGTIRVEVGNGDNIVTRRLRANGDALIVKNRKTASNALVPGNIAQCQPVHSADTYKSGQFPISVVDAAAFTRWQPEFANNLSSITVTIPDSASKKKVTGFYFDWAQQPPSNATVVFHDKWVADPTKDLPHTKGSSGSDDNVITPIKVKISNPWDPKENNEMEIKLLGSNSTNYTFSDPVPATKYATLFIEGNQGLFETDIKFKNGTGATVAEWAILSK